MRPAATALEGDARIRIHSRLRPALVAHVVAGARPYLHPTPHFAAPIEASITLVFIKSLPNPGEVFALSVPPSYHPPPLSPHAPRLRSSLVATSP